MTRGPCLFKLRDVKRAIKAAKAAGLDVWRVDIEPGRISVIAVGEGPKPAKTNAWDEVLAAREGNGQVGDTVSYDAPEGNSNMLGGTHPAARARP